MLSTSNEMAHCSKEHWLTAAFDHACATFALATPLTIPAVGVRAGTARRGSG
jgi:hypothetical protein